jgi:FAD/FMN-containing dehydrogenase
MVPHSNGAAYINFLGDEGDTRVISAYGAENFARLADAKRTYDPTNVFRFNQNIRAAEHV